MQSREFSYDSIVMRELGQSLSDKGLFEINLASGDIEWANDFMLSQYNMTLDQIQSMTIFDITPNEHHDALTSFISDEAKGRSQKFSIWPGKTANGKLIWWYVTKAKGAYPTQWYKTEYLNTTEKNGPEYTSMLATMQTANNYNDLASKLADHQEWTKNEISRINTAQQNLIRGQAEMQEQLNHCLHAANRAANEAVEANSSITRLKSEMADQFAGQTTAILKLITTDTVHDKRMAAFETSINAAAAAAAATAIKEISTSAQKAGQTITTQAHRASQGLVRKVTIPVSMIAAIATVIQWLITTYLHR